MADSFLWAEIFMLIFMIMLFTLGNLLVENFGSVFGLVFIAGTFIWGYGRLGSAKRELIGMSDTGSSKGLKRALAKDLATIRTMGAKKLLTADALKADNNRTQYIKLRDDFLSNYNELKIKLS